MCVWCHVQQADSSATPPPPGNPDLNRRIGCPTHLTHTNCVKKNKMITWTDKQSLCTFTSTPTVQPSAAAPYSLHKFEGLHMLVFFSPAARRQEEESVRTFYVGEVALTETKLTQMIHTCGFFFARTFPSTPCIFSSAVHRIKTSILSFLADLS